MLNNAHTESHISLFLGEHVGTDWLLAPRFLTCARANLFFSDCCARILRILCQSNQKLSAKPVRDASAQLGILHQIPPTGTACPGEGQALCCPAQGTEDLCCTQSSEGLQGILSCGILPRAGRQGKKSPADYPTHKIKHFQLSKTKQCPELGVGKHIPELCSSRWAVQPDFHTDMW